MNYKKFRGRIQMSMIPKFEIWSNKQNYRTLSIMANYNFYPLPVLNKKGEL